MVPTINIRSLHKEYSLWMNELSFCKEEIGIFEQQLAEGSGSVRDQATAVGIEHFQNQFILQKEVIDHLKHDLHVSEKQLAAFVRELSGLGLESIKMDNHPQLRDRVFIFRKIYDEIKTAFRKFEAGITEKAEK